LGSLSGICSELDVFFLLSISDGTEAPHRHTECARHRIHLGEDTCCRGLALGVGLCLDRVHVGGTGREALAQHRNAASGGGTGNHDDGVVAHGGCIGIQEGWREQLGFLEGCLHCSTAYLVGFVTHLIVGLVAVDTRNCLINPRIHGIGCFSHESLRVTVLHEALNGFFEAFNRLLVVGFPRVQIAIGAGGLHENLESLVHR
jgi:hypothetical protein